MFYLLRLSLRLMKNRVRFAPSPTGPLHLGGIRTALYNYLFAKSTGGEFFLRIEDTDQNRYVPESEKHIIESLQWLGISPNEGVHVGGPHAPYRQSERIAIYHLHIDALLRNNKAYVAFDSPEELIRYRDHDKSFIYNYLNRHSLHNSLNKNSPYHKYKDVQSLEELKGLEFVIRLKVENQKPLTIVDQLRGTIEVQPQTLEDKILLKKDGWPTYHFADIVDDYLMETTHVIRGDEWLSSQPIHRVIYDSFGWKAPNFIHLPIILKPSGKGKLAKRDLPSNNYSLYALQWKENKGLKELGYVPDAITNYLSLLGWSPPTSQREEIFNIENISKEFSLNGLQKKPAVVNFDKLLWTNQNHIRSIPSAKLIDRYSNEFQELKSHYEVNQVKEIVDLVKSRISTIQDIQKELAIFISEPDIDLDAVKKIFTTNSLKILETFQKLRNELDDIDELKSSILNWSKRNDISVKTVMQTIRISIVGNLSGPDLFKILKFISKESTQHRIHKTYELFNKQINK